MIEKLKARLVDTVIEIGISSIIGAIMIGTIAIPRLIAVSTAGWDAYSIILWGLFPLILVGAWFMAVINRVKYGDYMGVR